MFFEDMFGGSFPGFHGHGRGGDSDDEPVDNESYYKLLGVDKNATEREVKKAFKKMAMKHHPDRGGDEETFKKIEKAKEVLTDENKRRLYDQFGEKGLQGAGGRGGGGDIFSNLFGGGRHRNRGPPKAKTIEKHLIIELKDVYLGSSIQKTWKIMTATKKTTCTRCDGRGSVRHLIRQGSMVLQTQRPCDACKQRGFILEDEREKEVTSTIHVPHGIKTGGKITLQGEGHSLPGFQTGDVVFVVQVQKHPVYKRYGADLACEQSLTLSEALCGYDFRLKHVSGKTLIVKSRPGEIVNPGSLKILKNFGLPQKGNSYLRGHLYIQFEIIFPLPETLPTVKRKAIEAALADAEFPDVEKKIELGQGSRVRVHLAANAAERIYKVRRQMVAKGVISTDRMDGDAWSVCLDPLDDSSNSPPIDVVVPAAWVEPDIPGSRKNSKSSTPSGKKKKKRKNQKPPKEDKEEEDEYLDEEEEEEVSLEDIKGERPKPTPASGGSAAQEEEEAERGGPGGVQCQQM